MLLTFPSGPVMMDDKELCRDLKILIKPETLQGRMKFTDPQGNPVDLVVQGCTKPKIANMGTAEMSMYGIEELSKTPFRLKLELKIFKELFKLSGTIGNKQVNFQGKSLISIALEVIQHITSQMK